MKQLSGLDASFLFAETARTPMHVGSLTVVEPADGETPAFERILAFLGARVGRVRTMRERIVEVPLGLGHPFWIEDPNFAFEEHVSLVALPEPRGMEALTRLVTERFAVPLSRTRPLWDMTCIQGLGGIAGFGPGAFGLLTRVHHAAIDGVAGAAMLAALLEPAPEATAPAALAPWRGEPIPSAWTLLREAARTAAHTPEVVGRLVPRLVRAASDAATAASQRVLGVDAPGAARATTSLAAPPTRLDGRLAATRTWGWAELALDRLRALKTAHGVSLNDVLVAICAGALRQLLTELGELPPTSLVAFVPVSVRSEGEDSRNQVSAMRASLATDEPDPVRRLQKIHASTTRAKSVQRAAGPKAVAELAELVPYNVGALAAHAYVGLGASRLLPPAFNTVVTNVAGPAEALYLEGARVRATIGIAPINEGIGLVHAVFSYAGQVTIAVCTARECVPDVEHYVALLHAALAELEAAPVPA